MESKERQKLIEEILRNSNTPQKGHIISEKLGVTRQIIVKDIAILRAEGKNIIATPEGYIMPNYEKNHIKKVIAVSHTVHDIEDELISIVKFGGTIEDVIVEHALYGEIRGMLMIKSYYDIQNFIKRLNKYKAEPLLILTGGVHLHTVVCENDICMKNILSELKSKGYLIDD